MLTLLHIHVHVNFMPSQEVESLCSTLDFGGPAMVPCKQVPHLPTIALDIQGRSFELKGEQYVLKIEAGEICVSVVHFGVILGRSFVPKGDQYVLKVEAGEADIRRLVCVLL